MDWLPYLEFAAPLLPWKAAARSVVSHTASLSLGLAAFLTSQTLKGEAAMHKPTFSDYVIAHPLFVPFWVAGFVYLFQNLSPEGFLGSLVVVLFFLFWFRQWLQSLTAILDYQSAKPVVREREEVLPCIEPANT